MASNVKVGDHVRFLNEVGGGRVTRKEGNTVYVEDEDGYLRKDFYLDSNLFNKEMQKRKVVCEGCRKYVKNYDCDNYIYCSEAFARGVKKALTDKEFVKRLLK